jgi:hypothetical protein
MIVCGMVIREHNLKGHIYEMSYRVNFILPKIVIQKIKQCPRKK